MSWVFEITAEQAQKITAWKAEQDAIVLAKQRAEASTECNSFQRLVNDELDAPYYGACGGEVSYTFTPTSIGTILTATHSGTGAELPFYDDL